MIEETGLVDMKRGNGLCQLQNQFHIKWVDDKVIISIGHIISTVDINAIIEILISDKRFDLSASQIWDYSITREVKTDRLGFKVISKLHRCSLNWNKGMEIGIVLKSGVIHNTLAGYLGELINSEINLKCYNSLESALSREP